MSPTRLRYRIVDVFTGRPLAGNALCVVLDETPDELMPRIAREANLSETTFPTVTGDRAYTVRIFTPGAELPFAGHPSLGTAWALGPGRWTQTTSGATVTIEADAAGAVMGQPDPTFTDRPDLLDAAIAALGLPGAEAVVHSEAGGMTHVLVPTTAPIDELRPDMAAVAEVAAAAGGTSLAPVRRLDDATLHARVFLPGTGIPEDPGTGSAAGPFALLARQRWGTKADVTIHQGAEMGRPCTIEVHAEPGAVTVGGGVAAAAEGTWVL